VVGEVIIQARENRKIEGRGFLRIGTISRDRHLKAYIGHKTNSTDNQNGMAAVERKKTGLYLKFFSVRNLPLEDDYLVFILPYSSVAEHLIYAGKKTILKNSR